MIRRRATFVLVTMTLMMFAGAPASATPPTHERSQASLEVDFGSEICGFPLLAHVEQSLTVTTFFDADGEPTGGLVTGPIFVTFTDGHDSVRLAIPGPTFLDAEGDPVRGTGPWVTFTSGGEFVYAVGNIRFDADGNAVEISGMSVSVCDLLA
jgi:hypothetical protein